MFKSNYKGYGSGIISAMAWGLDTVLVGVILYMAPFINTEATIMLAPFVSTLFFFNFMDVYLYDFYKTSWKTF